MNSTSSDAGTDDVGAAARALLLACGLAGAGLATVGGFAPSQALPWPPPPLHARCLAALQAAAALPWILAWRERDSAALRIPLAQMLAGSGATAAVTALRSSELATLQPAAWAWFAWQLVLAAGAAVWLARLSQVQAPAERPDRALLAAAALVGGLAALLAVDARLAAAFWPWPLPPEPAVLYSGALAGWAVALTMLARERRRDARRLGLCGLIALGCLVTPASWWHRTAFHHPASGLAWVAAFGAVSVVAWRRLAGTGRGGRLGGLRRVRPSDR